MSAPLTLDQIKDLIRDHPPGQDLGNGDVELYSWEDVAALTCEKLLNAMHEELRKIGEERDELKVDHVYAKSVINTEKGIIEEAGKAYLLIKEIITNDGTMLRPSIVIKIFELYPNLLTELK